MRDIKKYVKWYFNPPNMDKKLHKAMEREYRDSLIRKKKSFSNCVGRQVADYSAFSNKCFKQMLFEVRSV